MRVISRPAMCAAFLVLVFACPSLFAQAAAPETAPAVLPITDPFGAASPEAKAAVKASQDLAAAGNWRKAWDALAAFDAANTDPYALALKITLCLDGYVQTDMHRSFALVDLSPGQTVDALRAQGKEGEVFGFDPLTIIQELSGAGTVLPPVLLEAFGDYCYDVQATYGDQWLASEQEVCSMGLSCYEEASNQGLSSARSLLRKGELLLRFGRNDEAEAAVKASLEKDPTNYDAQRTLALAYAQELRYDEALKVMDSLIPQAKAGDQRFEAYMLAANIAASIGAPRVEAYLQPAEKEFPGEPGPSLLRHQLSLKEADTSVSQVAADRVLDRFPNSPYVVRNILTNWLGADKTPEAKEFLDRNIGRRGVKEATRGILYFYRALLVAQFKGPEGFGEAKADLEAAEAAFTATYPAGDPVFDAIAQLRAQLVAEPEAAEPENK